MSNAALQVLDHWMRTHGSDPDSSFVTRFLARRDEDAFAALVHRHGPLVYGTCRRILGNRDESDDAFQAVFFVLARRAHTLKLDRSIGPWLHGVAVRVARKLRGQIAQRRLREMSAAKSERVEAAEPDGDFWAIVDEELACLSGPQREVVVLCDLGGQSHAQAAKSLGLAKGTVTKRLARAHEQLATCLRRRGITLGAGALASTMAAQASAAVPAPLLLETARQAVAFSIGQVGSSVVAKTLAEGVMRSLKYRALKVWLVVGLLGLTLGGGGLILAGGPRDPGDKNADQPQARADARAGAAKAGTVWKEGFTCEHESSLPVSVALSADGKWVLVGDTAGEVTALYYLTDDPPTYRWKAQVGGSHAAVAYSADGKQVYATTANGVCILDAATGKHLGRLEAPDSNPIAIGVFPNRDGRSKIAFGNARGYFIEDWAEGKLETKGTIETSTVAKDAKPADVAAVPLAVDPKGRSAIMTGLRDGTGQFTGVKGKNVLWAYVCGDYSEGSPGNRVMIGHSATVVAAAWSKEGSSAVTGDADGRVIVWDTKTMKEARRIELGGRVAAIAISDDGANTAACIRGKRGGEVYVWETAKPASALKPIHTQLGEFGSDTYACLTFSADGKRLGGCVIDKQWPQAALKKQLAAQVHVWELSAEPRAQPAPRHIYTQPLPSEDSNFVITSNNYTFLKFGTKEGGMDFHDLRDGHIQGRIVLGKFAIGGVKVSADYKWMAMEQHASPPGKEGETFDVGVYFWPPIHSATIPSCSQLLAVASGGKHVAVVRDKQIELWDAATPKKLKAALFKHTRIDAASFSPNGKLLAISDQNTLVLWRWEENTHERIDLGHCVGSLTFSPDGRFLAEGPTPGDSIQIRDVETRKVVQTLSNSTKTPMNVPRMVYTQGSRVLITCDTSKETPARERITVWDTANGSIARHIPLQAGVPQSVHVSPSGRYLAAVVDNAAAGTKLEVWRLDGEMMMTEAGPAPPASGSPP
jgi:RNA polymerase sigma factor (sigma-70 family)